MHESILPVRSFFFARHGQTVDNAQGIISGGERNTPLTDEGKVRADSLALPLMGLSDQISCIFCSPMDRAQETARRANALARKEIIVIPTLYEWMVGDLAGLLDADYKEPLSNWTLDPPNGESRVQLVGRVQTALQECARQIEGRQGDPLIVAHAGVWWGLSHLLGMKKEPITNCELFKVQDTPSGWQATHIAGSAFEPR